MLKRMKFEKEKKSEGLIDLYLLWGLINYLLFNLLLLYIKWFIFFFFKISNGVYMELGGVIWIVGNLVFDGNIVMDYVFEIVELFVKLELRYVIELKCVVNGFDCLKIDYNFKDFKN